MQGDEMSTTDTRAAFDKWDAESKGHHFNPDRDWIVWQAATEAAKATGTAGDLPPLKSINDDAGFWQKVSNWAHSDEGDMMEIRAKQMTDYVDQKMREYGQACAEAARHDADAAKRLRLICKLVGIESHVPADDETLWGAAFAVLGQVRAALEAARQPAPVVVVKPWQERMNPSLGWCEANTLPAMQAEIADLRAALAATNRSQP